MYFIHSSAVIVPDLPRLLQLLKKIEFDKVWSLCNFFSDKKALEIGGKGVGRDINQDVVIQSVIKESKAIQLSVTTLLDDRTVNEHN